MSLWKYSSMVLFLQALLLPILLAAAPACAAGGENATVFVQLGHRSAVTSVTISPDGKRIASASLDGAIRLWDMHSSREIRTLSGHQSGVLSIAFSPDGKLLASGGRDRTVRIWDTATGSALQVLKGHENIVLAVAFSPDGREIYSGDYDGNVHAWDVAKGSLTLSSSQDGAIRAIAFSRNGQQLAIALDSGDLKVFRHPGFSEQTTLHGHQGAALALAFCPDGKLASAGQDGSARIWDIPDGNAQQLPASGKSPFAGISCSADGHWIAAAGRDGVIRVWDARTHASAHELRGHEGEVLSLAFAPRNDKLVSAGQDRNIHVWNVAEHRQENMLGGQASDVRAIAHNARSNQLAVAGADGTIRLWDTRIGKVIHTLEEHKGSIEALAFSPDGTLLASAGQNGVVRLWNSPSGTLQQEFARSRGTTHALAFSPDGKQLASGGQDTIICIWNIGDRKLERELLGHKMSVRGLAWSPDGKTLASASYDDTAKLWNAADGTLIRTYGDHSNRLTAIAFTPDGAWLVTGSEDSTLRMHALSGNAPARALEGHSAPVRSIAITPDGQEIVSASVDGTLARWDVASGKLLSSVPAQDGQLLAVTTGADAGGTIWTGGNGGATVVLTRDGRERARLYGFADGGWASITPEGFFNASDSGAQHLNVRMQGEVYGLEQFTESFFRPDAVRTALLATTAQQEENRRSAAQRAEAEKAEAERVAQERAERERIAHEQALADAQKKEEAARQEQARIAAQQAEHERTEARRKQELEQQALVRAETERQQQEEARRKAEQERSERERLQALANMPPATTPTVTPSRPQHLTEVRPAPTVEIVDTPLEASTPELPVSLRVTDAGGGIGDIRLYLNGTAVLLDSTRNLAVSANRAGQETFHYRVKLVNGENILKAIAFNAGNTMQSTDAIHRVTASFRLTRRPSLHALVVGIQEYRNTRLNLQYSVADAKMFAETMRRSTAGLFGATDIRLLTTPAETSKTAIAEALRAMQNRVNPEDLFVFYVASHATVEDGNYILITSNVGSTSSERLRQDAIGQSLLKDLLANIPATKKFIVLDTCNAGKLGEAIQLAFLTRGMSEDMATKILSRAVGSTVLSAATSQQEAVEGYNGHGLFTWVVVEGLRGEADLDKDHFVKTTELAEYVDNNVPLLAERTYHREQFPIVSPTGMQFPLTRVGH